MPPAEQCAERRILWSRLVDATTEVYRAKNAYDFVKEKQVESLDALARVLQEATAVERAAELALKGHIFRSMPRTANILRACAIHISCSLSLRLVHQVAGSRFRFILPKRRWRGGVKLRGEGTTGKTRVRPHGRNTEPSSKSPRKPLIVSDY